MTLQDQIDCLWGKTDDLRKRDDRRGRWLPLIVHLKDTASVAGHIFDGLGDLAREPLRHGTSSDREARDRFVALAGLHDIGKATPAHVSVIGDHPTAAKKLTEIRASGLIVEQTNKSDMHHSLAAYPILMRKFGPSAKSSATTIANHHGWAHTQDSLDKSVRVLRQENPYHANLGWMEGEDGDWFPVQSEIIDRVLDEFGIDPAVLSIPIPHYDQFAVVGLLMLCDWLASDTRFFHTHVDHTEWTPQRAVAAWRDIGFPEPWRPGEDRSGSLYPRRFDDFASGKYQPYPMQTEVERIADSLDSPALMIVESGMGSGKTEAALVAGEVFTRNLGGSGICFSMPTMATTDSVFDRIVSWAGYASRDGSPISLHLGHARNTFSKSFQSLLEGSAAGLSVASDDSGEDDSVSASRVLSEKMGLFAPVSANTVDQVAKFALNGRNSFPLQGALVGKTVVFDEVHTYDSYTMEFLLISLSYLAAHRCPVIVLSATLGADRRREIMESYISGARSSWCKDHDDELSHEEPNAYPLISVADPRTAPRYVPITGGSGEPEKDISVSVHLDSSDELLSRLISQRTPRGGCVGVIRSTVARAQDAYRHLREAFPDDEVVLLHSRFTSKHRDERISDIESVVGRRGKRPSGGRRYIVVSTQVIEQSMDFDFDYMISDVAPLDMLAQRTGRLWRHQQNTDAGRPVDRAVFDIVSAEVSPENFCFRTGIESKIGFIYNHYQLHVAAREMSSREVFRTPQDIAPLIARMGEEPDGENRSESSMHAQWEAQDAERRQRAQGYCIEPVSAHEEGWHQSATHKCNTREMLRRNTIRDADGSVEGILVRYNGSEQETVDGTPVLTGLDASRAIEVGSNTIRLPIIRGVSQDSFEGRAEWEKSPVLKGRKAIPVVGGKVDVGGVLFTYSEEIGLVRERSDHDEV